MKQICLIIMTVVTENSAVSWFTKENVTFLIAIVSFLMSALTWIREFWLRRKTIDVTVIDYADRRDIHGVLQFYFLFQNRSSIPAYISKIELEVNEDVYCCELEPKLIKKIAVSDLTVTTP